jgi:hypothetical protein
MRRRALRSRFREEIRLDEREGRQRLWSITGRELLWGQAEWVSGDEGDGSGASRAAAGMKYLSQYDAEKGRCVSGERKGPQKRKGLGWLTVE